MYGLTTIKRLIKSVWLRQRPAAFAVAALVSVAALSAPARAQSGTSGPDFQFQSVGSAGLASGQTLRLRIAVANNQGKRSDVIVGPGVGGGVHVKAFSGATGELLWSRELTSLTAGLHTFDINRDELPAAGEPGTGRLQLWIEVLIVPRPAGRARAGAPGLTVLPATFEVMENVSGRTTASGGVWKTTNFLTADPFGTRPISFTGLE